LFCEEVRIRTFQCNSPVDCCLPPARWRQHLYLLPPGANENESVLPHQAKTQSLRTGFLVWWKNGRRIRTHLNAARTSAAGEGWTEPNLYFLSLLRKKMQIESVLPHHKKSNTKRCWTFCIECGFCLLVIGYVSSLFRINFPPSIIRSGNSVIAIDHRLVVADVLLRDGKYFAGVGI